MDCARQHLETRVFQSARRQGFDLLFVPARLTWLLQPLDTHAFSPFKHKLRMLHARLRATSNMANVSKQTWALLIAATIREVLEGRNWAKAFNSTGVSADQERVSSYVKRKLGLDNGRGSHCGDDAPLHGMDCLLPRRSKRALANMAKFVFLPRPLFVEHALRVDKDASLSLRSHRDSPSPPSRNV